MEAFASVITKVVADRALHARWLNTLSLMENCGARKISASEDPARVRLETLRHAAEEARHAFYLKNQIRKLGENFCPSYERPHLLAARASRRYIDALDARVSRFLKDEAGLTGRPLRDAAYLLVTYAIEVRAEFLYPAYERALKQAAPAISVRSILAEEEGHLTEMRRMIRDHFGLDAEHGVKQAVELESELFQRWLKALESDPALS